MRSFVQFLKEDNEDEKKTTERGDIKFTIWEAPDKKVKWLENNKDYQKIEYKYEDNDKNIFIDFLLGFKDGSWRLWIGKIGSVSYDDDPFTDLKTNKFAEAIVKALDKVQEFIEDVKKEPVNYVQFYKDR